MGMQRARRSVLGPVRHAVLKAVQVGPPGQREEPRRPVPLVGREAGGFQHRSGQLVDGAGQIRRSA